MDEVTRIKDAVSQELECVAELETRIPNDSPCAEQLKVIKYWLENIQTVYLRELEGLRQNGADESKWLAGRNDFWI